MLVVTRGIPSASTTTVSLICPPVPARKAEVNCVCWPQKTGPKSKILTFNTDYAITFTLHFQHVHQKLKIIVITREQENVTCHMYVCRIPVTTRIPKRAASPHRQMTAEKTVSPMISKAKLRAASPHKQMTTENNIKPLISNAKTVQLRRTGK